MEQKQRVRLGAVGILVLVFGSGVALGMALDRNMGSARAGTEVTADAGAAADTAEGRERERRPPMYRQVGELTELQEASIDSVLREHRAAMKALQKEFSEAYDPRYWAIVEHTREGIARVMTPEQRERYDSLLAAYDRRRHDEDSTRAAERSSARRP